MILQATVGAMAAEMRGTPSGRPSINRRVSVFDLGGGSRVPPGIASPSQRSRALPTAASFSVGSGSGSGSGGIGGGGSASSGVSPRAPSRGGDGSGRSPAGSGPPSAPPLHRKPTPAEDPEMLDLLRNQLEALAMAKEAEVLLAVGYELVIVDWSVCFYGLWCGTVCG